MDQREPLLISSLTVTKNVTDACQRNHWYINGNYARRNFLADLDDLEICQCHRSEQLPLCMLPLLGPRFTDSLENMPRNEEQSQLFTSVTLV